jgi:uncharacterized iron-regulated membrane protein
MNTAHMMRPATLRAWLAVHKWTSLVCTAFMLLLCLTGLPLIFYEEILALDGSAVRAPDLPPDTPEAALDAVVAAGQARHPDRVVQFLSRDAHEPYWFVSLGERADSDPELNRFVAVDARTAQVLAEPRFDEGVMHFLFHLHVDLFAGLPGKLFLGTMGVLLVASLVSGAVVYGPFMRKLGFGTVRRERGARVRWLDLHNLLGIVTLVWVLVVGGTGVINTWADLLFRAWQANELTAMVAPYRDLPPPATRGSVQRAVQAARAAEPGMEVSFVAFPGTPFSGAHHHGVFMRGTAALSSRLLKPVLVEVDSAQVTAARPLPWYLTALLVSQPLHFGDYGGLPLKVLWALLDGVTIVVLGSGLYLWLARRGWRVDARIADLRAAAP